MAAEEASGAQEFPHAEAPETPDPQTPKPEEPKLPENPGQGLPDPKKVGRTRFVVDVLERAVATYLETLVGLLVVSDKLDLKHISAVALSAVPAGLSVIKAGLARFLGDKSSAAFVPRRLHNWAARRAGLEILPPRRVKAA